jgi:hypothetical protein
MFSGLTGENTLRSGDPGDDLGVGDGVVIGEIMGDVLGVAGVACFFWYVLRGFVLGLGGLLSGELASVVLPVPFGSSAIAACLNLIACLVSLLPACLVSLLTILYSNFLTLTLSASTVLLAVWFLETGVM